MIEESSTGRFWRLADPLLAESDIERGTLMGFDCLRVGGEFAAAPHHRDDGLIVKLPEERVTDLTRTGAAKAFAPAGRVFREWAHVPGGGRELWQALIDEAVAFARS